MFVHLHWHSTFSFLEAIGKINKITERVKELEMSAVAITDYNWLYGTIKFLQYAKDSWIKPIIGVELGFVLDVNSVVQKDQIWNIVLLAKNLEGYQNLMEIVSFANTTGIAGKPKIDINILKQYGQWVIAIFGGTQSWIGKMISYWNNSTKIPEIIALIQDALWKDNTLCEIISQDESLDKDLEKINHEILEIAKKLDIKCVVNSNYHYIKKVDRAAWEIALDIKDGKKIYDLDTRKPHGELYIMSEDEIREVLKNNKYSEQQIDIWINNNVEIADSINLKISLWQTLFPNYDSPEDIKQTYEEIKDKLVENE